MDSNALKKKLSMIDGKGYKAYKDIQGIYKFKDFTLAIDYVQGDPFASPSKIRVIVDQKVAKIPQELFSENHKRVATIDYLTRVFHGNIIKQYQKVRGSGKSGLLSIDNPAQEMLDRTSVYIDKDRVEARLEVGLPAAGRRVLSREAEEIFFNALPYITIKSLVYSNIDRNRLQKQVELIDDQEYIRAEMKNRGLSAFVANGSVLPRESGISQRPLKTAAIKFNSPKELEVEFNTPNRGTIKGMGIKDGITLIVGGGYHGKSTLLRALELGVYNHIEGDGREFVLTNAKASKIRSEDGRRIEKVNITPFINNLPNKKDTLNFSTDNASGSTSQAANIMEALEQKSNLLLIDEDTSATNFMIRDKKMQQLVFKSKEPITPFIDRVRSLYEDHGVSTIMVVGSLGDYFGEVDCVIMMDEYIPYDVTQKAIEIYNQNKVAKDEIDHNYNLSNERAIKKSSFPATHKGVKVQSKGLYTVMYNKDTIHLGEVEQLIAPSQTNCIATMIKYARENVVDDKKTLTQVVDEVYNVIDRRGIAAISGSKGHPGNLALPRKHEFAAALNRFRNLQVK